MEPSHMNLLLLIQWKERMEQAWVFIKIKNICKQLVTLWWLVKATTHVRCLDVWKPFMPHLMGDQWLYSSYKCHAKHPCHRQKLPILAYINILIASVNVMTTFMTLNVGQNSIWLFFKDMLKWFKMEPLPKWLEWKT